MLFIGRLICLAHAFTLCAVKEEQFLRQTRNLLDVSSLTLQVQVSLLVRLLFFYRSVSRILFCDGSLHLLSGKSRQERSSSFHCHKGYW
jgi:hypothetical protein